MADLKKLTAANASRWSAMHLSPSRKALCESVARRLVAPAAKQRYNIISANTGVPWWVIAVIHEREASQRFDRSIAQGDPWNAVSTHVPKHRGPFRSFEEAAYDALKNCEPHAGLWKDWSIGGTLCLLEQYNGLGYAGKGRPSPYIWAGTDQYVSGKYVSDGVYDPHAVDQQLGCAGLLATMAALDSDVRLGAPIAAPAPTPAPVPKPSPEPPKAQPEAPHGILGFLLWLLNAIFQKRTK